MVWEGCTLLSRQGGLGERRELLQLDPGLQMHFMHILGTEHFLQQ